MDELSATSISPVTHPACSEYTTSQSGSPQRRVIILPARGSISPIKVTTSPKRISSPHVFTPGNGSQVLPVCGAYTNCSVVGNKHVVSVRTANMSDTPGICFSVSHCVSSTAHGISSESDARMLSTTLQVDSILTSSSENASRHGIISVACRESCVQETSVLSPVTSISRLPASASDDDHSVLPDSDMTLSALPVHMYQSSSCMTQVATDKISSTHVKLDEVSPNHAVSSTCTVSHAATGTRTVNVTSIRKICPSTDAQKRSVVVKLFPEHSGSRDVQTAEQCAAINVTSPSASSPKRVVLLPSTVAQSTRISGVCSPAVQQSTGFATGINVITTCHQWLSSLNTVTTAAKAVSVIPSSSCHTTASSHSWKVTESVALPSNGSLMCSSISNTVALPVLAENLSNGYTRSEDDSDDDSVVIIDTDVEPSLPSPSRNSKKRSSAAQNIILLNHHKSASQPAVDSKQSSSNAAATSQSRTKRKPVLGTRLLESASDEGIILPVSCAFENGGRSSQPNRRKSFPQRRTDTSAPQLQFCTKQWKRDINYSRSTIASPTHKHSQSRSPKKDTDSETRTDKADSITKSEPLLSQSNLQSSQNVSDRRKRKPVDHCESSMSQGVKRTKRLSPVKRGNAYCNKNIESANSVVHKAAVDASTVSTSLSPQSVTTVSPCSSMTTNTTKTISYSEVKTAVQDTESSSELQVLGKDKRSMEMSVTNEDGVVENLLVTIIDISSSEEDDNDDTVEIHSLSNAKLDSSEVSVPKAETSQSVAAKPVSSTAGSAVKTVQDKSHVNSRTLPPNDHPVSESSCNVKPIRQKFKQTAQRSSMGRKVLVSRERASLNDACVNVTKVKQITQLPGKSISQKHSKTDASTSSVKQLKVDSDSAAATAAAAAGSLGPVVHIRGSKDCPVSCCVVSGARDLHDETAARSKRKSVVLSSSCYPTSFQLRDSVPWRCIFCHQGSSYRTLGDLFGPYYAKTDDPAKSDSVKCQSLPSKSRSSSVKRSQQNSYVLVSQRRRQQSQKYIALKSPQKSPTSPNKGIPPEIWLHEDCAIWTNGICFSPTGQLCGLEAAITLSLQMVCTEWPQNARFNAPY